MKFTNQWKPDFKKWHNVNNDTYKLIFEQAEKKMDDVLSESESITDKSIKMVIAVTAIFSFFIGFVINNNIQNCISIPFATLFIADTIGIIFLIFPKKIRGRGIEPKTLLPNNLDNEDDKEHQEQIVYYSGIVILQNNIDFMIRKNTSRANLYLACLICTLTLLVLGASYIFISL